MSTYMKATLLESIARTTTVAVRAVSIACIGSPNSLKATLSCPVTGFITRRTTPAKSVLDILNLQGITVPIRDDARSSGIQKSAMRFLLGGGIDPFGVRRPSG